MKELLDTVDELKGRWLVTADHGNADDMVQRTKKGEPIFDEGKPVPLTSHTLAPVGVHVGGKGLPEGTDVCIQLSLCSYHHAKSTVHTCEPAAVDLNSSFIGQADPDQIPCHVQAFP